MKFSTKDIVYIGLLSCLVIVATFINFVIPIGGGQGALVHLGTTVSVIAVLVFKTRIGTLSGAIGMTLFDILGGWAIWAPATLIARLGLGYILGKCAFSNHRDANNWWFNFLGLVLGGLFMIAIYYVYEAILYSNWIIALGSIPANVLQLVLALVIGFPLSFVLKKVNRF